MASLVVGQDTVIATPYRGKIYWFWGYRRIVRLILWGILAPPGQPPNCLGAAGSIGGVGVDLAYFVDGSGTSNR